MNKRKLGRTNLHVSEFCLNTAKFGSLYDEATSFELLDTYYLCGGTFIQSIASFGGAALIPTAGSISEDIVGRWIQARRITRDGLVLATRIALARPAHGGSIAFANLIREGCERSLRQLRTKHLDLLVCDWDEHLTPIEDVLEAVDMLIRAGRVRYAVARGFPPWRVVDSLHRSGARNHARFEAVQAEYSLMTRAKFEAETLGMCREHRLGFLAHSPLAGGFLAKSPATILESANLNPCWQSERFGNNAGDAVLTALTEISEKRLVSPAQLALAWVLRNGHVSSALVSATSSRDLRDLLRAGYMTLTDEEAGALANVTSVQDYRMELRHA